MGILGCNNFTIPLRNILGADEKYSSPDFTLVNNLITDLTVFYIAAYGLVFFVSYVQLWMVLHYHCKRYSFQTAFLFLCLLWSALRVTLFSAAIYPVQLPKSALVCWIFFHLPMCLQFFIFCLLTLYYAQVSFRIRPEYHNNPRRYLYPLRCTFGFLAALGLTVSLACNLIVFNGNFSESSGTDMKYGKTTMKAAVSVNVILSDMLSLICAIMLTVVLIRVAKSPSAHTLLRSKGTTVCRSLTIGLGMVLLSLSSAMYDLIALSSVICDKTSFTALFWYYDLTETQDQFAGPLKWSFFTYGVTLFVGELLPTSLIIFLHKIDVNCCRGSLHADLENSMTQHFRSPVFFYDNPRVHSESVTSKTKEESENAALLPSTSATVFAYYSN